MKFTDAYKLNLITTEWFDPFLTLDTALFVDPFLIYAQEFEEFEGSHSELVHFFQTVFELLAKAGGNKQSPSYSAAENALILPEVAELCLGYSSDGTGGAGSGRVLAKIMAQSMSNAIALGEIAPEHFEEVSIISGNIGPDRISDATVNILRHRFSRYTEPISNDLKIPTIETRFPRGRYDPELHQWVPCICKLPLNPYNNLKMLLAPKKYLRELPTINAYDFWEYCYHNHTDMLAKEFGRDLTRRVNKERIIELAQKYRGIREEYIQHVENTRSVAYDFTADSKGVIQWYEPTKSYSASHPLTFRIVSHEDFLAAIEKVIGQYRHFVEENRGWTLLWNEDGTMRSEEAAQLVFLGIVKFYCNSMNIDVSRETDIGRGPVDFKFASSYSMRALLEVKKANNSKFWNGLKKQLPTYMKAEEVKTGWLLVVVLSDADQKKISDLKSVVESTRKDSNLDLRFAVVDARQKQSASKL